MVALERGRRQGGARSSDGAVGPSPSFAFADGLEKNMATRTCVRAQWSRAAFAQVDGPRAPGVIRARATLSQVANG